MFRGLNGFEKLLSFAMLIDRKVLKFADICCQLQLVHGFFYLNNLLFSSVKIIGLVYKYTPIFIL